MPEVSSEIVALGMYPAVFLELGMDWKPPNYPNPYRWSSYGYGTKESVSHFSQKVEWQYRRFEVYQNGMTKWLLKGYIWISMPKYTIGIEPLFDNQMLIL